MTLRMSKSKAKTAFSIFFSQFVIFDIPEIDNSQLKTVYQDLNGILFVLRYCKLCFYKNRLE